MPPITAASLAPAAAVPGRTCRCPPARRPVRAAASPAATTDAAQGGKGRPLRPPPQALVKVCGLTSEADAALAAGAGADLLGIILWPRARRSVPPAAARSIVAAGRAAGAKQVVGVFVDEDAAAIEAACVSAGVTVAQLHGDGARAALPHLPAWMEVVYVLQAGPDGRVVTPSPAAVCEAAGAPFRTPEYVLLDGLQGGSGEGYDWAGVIPPAGLGAKGWLLAGGLGPDNVCAAVRALHPTGVDVSSGVCGPDGLAKDGGKVRDFVRAAKAAGLE